MASADEKAYWLAELAKLELRITAYQNAIDEFIADGSQMSYTLDTGQDKIEVERMPLWRMERTLESYYRRRDFMCVRAGRLKPGHHGRPSW